MGAERLSVDQRKMLLSARSDEDWRTNDGMGFEEGLRYPWRSADALIRRGLLRYVGWIDEDVGREYEATPAGIAWLREHGWPHHREAPAPPSSTEGVGER